MQVVYQLQELLEQLILEVVVAEVVGMGLQMQLVVLVVLVLLLYPMLLRTLELVQVEQRRQMEVILFIHLQVMELSQWF